MQNCAISLVSRISVLSCVLLSTPLALGCGFNADARKQAYLKSGNEYVEQSKFAEAVIEYRNAIQLDARYAEAHLKLAETYARLGDHAKALASYVRAADLMPDDAEVQITAGNYLLVAGQPEQAGGRAEKVLEKDPLNVRAHVLRGNVLAGLKNFDEAIQEIEEAIQLDPKRSPSYATLGAIESSRGRRAQAEAAFKRAVEINPDWVEGYLALVNHYWATKELPKAEQALLKALELDPLNPLANRGIALFYLSTGRVADAEKYFAAAAKSSEMPFALADYFLAVGRPKDAVGQLVTLKKQPPLSDQADRRLVRAHADAGDTKQSESIADKILERSPKDPDMLLAKGELLARAGKDDEAVRQVRAAAEAAPSSATAQFVLGKMLASRGDVEAAKQAYNEVLRLNPRAGAAHVALARLYLIESSEDASLRAADEAVRVQPNDVEAQLARARGLLATGEVAQADAVIDRLLRQHSGLPSVHVQRGMVAIGRDDPAAARAAFRRALELDSDAVEAVAGLTALDLGDRNYASAKTRVDEQVVKSKSRPEVLILAARVYAATGDLASAEQFLRRAIDINPSLLPAYGMLGRLYLDQKRLQEAQREFDTLAQRQTKPVAALTMSALISEVQGNQTEARKRYEQVLSVDGAAPIAANNLAWMYAESGENLDRALQLAQTAATSSPDQPEVMDTLGWVYYKKNLPDLAIRQFSRCVEKEPSNGAYHHHLALAQLQAGQTEQARQSLQRALKTSSNPTTTAEIRQALASLSVPGASR
jgi:tetratricopeptide (TPR) repeat protein